MSKMSPDVVERLLDALAGDDAFRAAFESDPREALRSLGHVTPDRDLARRAHRRIHIADGRIGVDDRIPQDGGREAR